MPEWVTVLVWFVLMLALAIVARFVAWVRVFRRAGGGRRYDDGGIGLGEDAGVPSAESLRDQRRARPDDLARIGVAHAALRLRMDRHRLEAQRVRPFLCGPPIEDDPLDLDAITAAADRLSQSGQQCWPKRSA